ncbi:hypothetical protein AS026_07155 [Rhizobium altiplani]|uniref:Uncharacterized protein n=1 Tax=Rhizobium altiplani TaxID=1864509 RepID=A0A120FKR1_9HYPH|nr:hypothetical protein AS026_07155 [Rhizobium altiplani]
MIPAARDSAVIALIRKLRDRDGDTEETDLGTILLFACISDTGEIGRPLGAIVLSANYPSGVTNPFMINRFFRHIGSF